MPAHHFAIGEQDFLLDGQPRRIISGALHYFRVHPGQWTARIRAARLMGLNTIETYVPWADHEPQPGEFSATGALDLGAFLDLIHEEGMHAIVRPGPYICAEWDAGGLPGWLTREPGVQPRSSEPTYLSAATTYLERVMEIVAPLQIHEGGPVVLVQVENEYGAYGSDSEYLAHIVDVYRRSGITVPLTTVDQPVPDMLANGGLPGVLRTGSFGSRSLERLAALREAQPEGPLMCSEFWCGWFDHWGAHHHVTDPQDSARELDALLGAGASVNIYMVHGGTNFGLTSGANDKGVYQPTVTSYDYDAPLDEAGRPTAKFWAFRDVIARHASVPDLDPSSLPEPMGAAPPPAPLVRIGSLQDAMPNDRWTTTPALPTMDEMGHYRGLSVHRTTLDGADAPAVLGFGEVRDRVHVLLDGSPVGILSRDAHERVIELPRGRGDLELVVEDQGRVNYGPRIGEHKGIIGGVWLDGRAVEGWRSAPVPLQAIPQFSGGSGAARPGPTVFRATVDVGHARDLVIDATHLGKGIAWVGDFCLGRFWGRGPQRSLYVPGTALHDGRAEFTVLALDPTDATHLTFADDLILGHTEW
ncbi:glycoside hydrolase family 35 protein [Demequina aestuarii]|uniref:glycoside hydrolase family 35 protein n=1 Tax=Demequina aestuarii TaxID=327095 RepID=UPI000783D974|nr:beta-galactosidase family protein [Demequina aestuarii]